MPVLSLSGLFQFRRRAPVELRSVLGHEYKKSLKSGKPEGKRLLEVFGGYGQDKRLKLARCGALSEQYRAFVQLWSSSLSGLEICRFRKSLGT